jgi:Flp pilus assembly protein TadB
MIQLHYYIAFAGIWALGNGVLHDIFVLLQRRPYDRDLIRLLIDGHILIFAGIIYLLCYRGIQDHQSASYLIAITVALFVLGYCALIFKLLPSIGMIIVNAAGLIWLVAEYPVNVTL